MQMMAQRLYGPRDMRYMSVDVPELGDHDVRIKVKCCGICGTDYSIYSGEASFWGDGLIRTPMTFGHEYSGVIDAVGPKVEKFRPGDRVVSDTAVSCGVCETCLKGEYLKCEKAECVGTVNCRDGGYAEYTVMPERHVFHLPDNVSFEYGALNEPVATAMYACMRAGVSMADTVLILGTGPIGLGAIGPAKLMGASKVIAAGRKPFKLKAAEKLGADGVIDLTKEDLSKAAAALTNGKGFKRIIEATGSHELLRSAIASTTPGGCISSVAFYDNPVDKINMDRLVFNDITIAGSSGSTNIGPLVIKLMAEGKLDPGPLITGRVSLEDAGKALEGLKRNGASTIKILIDQQ